MIQSEHSLEVNLERCYILCPSNLKASLLGNPNIQDNFYTKHYTMNHRQHTDYGIDETNQMFHAEDLNQHHRTQCCVVPQNIYGNHLFFTFYNC